MILSPDGRPARAQATTTIPAEDSFYYAFESAKRLGWKGYFYFPTLDPAGQMPAWTRETTAERINWLYNNVGYVRAVIDGLSLEEVGTGIWPKAATSSAAFNTAATNRFHDTWEDARFFDSRKIEDVYSAQFLIRRTIRLHGALFGQLLRPGGGAPFARMHFVPFYQIRNCGPNLDGFVEGMSSDQFGATTAYRVSTGKGKDDWQEVSADDMLQFHDAFWVGQKTGISGLAPMARKLFTVDDIERLMANGIQIRTGMAYAIERADADNGGPVMLPGVTSVEEVDTPDNGKLIVQKIVGSTGREVSVADVGPGRKIKVLESQQNSEPLTFKKDVMADLSFCSLYPPEFVFSMAAGAGTEVRWKVDRVQNVKNAVRHFQIIPQFLRPAYRFRTWQDIKMGVYDDIPGGVPKDWFRVKWICPADTSVDQGRIGKLLDDRVASGKMSEDEYHGIRGNDSADVDDAILAKRLEREQKLADLNKQLEKLGLPPRTYEEIWPANTQAAANLAAQPSPPPDDNPPQ